MTATAAPAGSRPEGDDGHCIVSLAVVRGTSAHRDALERLLTGNGDEEVLAYTWRVSGEQLEATLRDPGHGTRDGSGPCLSIEQILGAVRDAAPEVRTGPRTPAVGSPGADSHGVGSPGVGDGDAEGWPGHEHGLSRRESEVLTLITAGLTNAEISGRCHLSANTVKTYIRSAYVKLGVRRRAEAVRWGMEHGLLDHHRG